MRYMLTRALQLAIAGIFSIAAGAHGDQASGYTLTPGIGFQMFDGEMDLQNPYYGSISAGYKFATTWGFEVTYQRSSTNFQKRAGSADIEQMRFDALYHFARNERTQPFVFFGGGQEKWNVSGNRFDNSIVNAGTGIKLWLNDWASVRTDIRIVNDIDNEQTSYALGLGINLMFGGNKAQADSEPVLHLPADTDGDGIFDTIDRCPDTAAEAEVDENGCTMVVDDDRDGIANADDICPDTAFGAKVDDSGCYILVTETEQISRQIEFQPNSTDVAASADSELQAIAEFMQEYPQAKVEIEGHTDDSGAADLNQRLSKRRADAVAKLLVEEYDIDPSRVSATGYGESRPLTSNDSEENRAKNRRVIATATAEVERIAQ